MSKGGAGFAMSFANKKGKVHLIDSFTGIIDNEINHNRIISYLKIYFVRIR